MSSSTPLSTFQIFHVSGRPSLQIQCTSVPYLYLYPVLQAVFSSDGICHIHLFTSHYLDNLTLYGVSQVSFYPKLFSLLMFQVTIGLPHLHTAYYINVSCSNGLVPVNCKLLNTKNPVLFFFFSILPVFGPLVSRVEY